MHEQEEINLQRRILEARIVPDIAGRDNIGRAALFLANGQPSQQPPEKLPYFVGTRV
ncbi:MAG: hypothetical protein WCJ60_00855 [bacterium]